MTFRSELATDVQTLLDNYQLANPTLLRDVRRSRPSALGETPVAWIGNISEALQHTSGVRRRELVVPVFVVDALTDNSEAAERLDVLVDALLDVFSDNPHGVSANTLIEPVSVTDVEIDGPYRGVSINLRGLIQEGRT